MPSREGRAAPTPEQCECAYCSVGLLHPRLEPRKVKGADKAAGVREMAPETMYVCPYGHEVVARDGDLGWWHTAANPYCPSCFMWPGFDEGKLRDRLPVEVDRAAGGA